MNRRQFLWLLPLALVGCGASTIRQQQVVDGVSFDLELPRQPELLQAYLLRVTLRDAQNQPIDGADVSFDLTMTTMPMGANQPLAEPRGNGVYETYALFTMDGLWQITVHARVAGRALAALFSLEF